ncbi:MAG: hypothetical protein NC433_01925 [Clostridiales bacterium]|nr:hypothetical protein [Clostridiales bacterium]
MVIKMLLLLAFAGHALCWVCDMLLIYAPGGKFSFECLKDNQKMAKVFAGMSLKKPLASMMLGLLALMMSFGGYFALYEWMKQFSVVYAVIMITAAVVFFISGAAHHVFCGAVEWFYIRLGRTEEARETALDFFKATLSTMYVCYLGQAVSVITLFIAVVTGDTSLPRWGCVFNVAPIYLILMLLKAPGAGNLAGMIMFLGLFIIM